MLFFPPAPPLFLELPRMREKNKLIVLPILKHHFIFCSETWEEKPTSIPEACVICLLCFTGAGQRLARGGFSGKWDLRSAKSCADRASITQQKASWASHSWVGNAGAWHLGSCLEGDFLKNGRNFQILAFLLQIKTKVLLMLWPES